MVWGETWVVGFSLVFGFSLDVLLVVVVEFVFEGIFIGLV